MTDWLLLWRQIAASQGNKWKTAEGSDLWKGRARSFSDGVKKRWAQPDSHREFVLSLLKANPDSTIIDIGAGTGGWAVPMARHARSVTALEPSPEMGSIMKENIEQEGLTNVDIVRASWPEADVAPHDFSLCSHAMYGAPDFAAFVNAMTRITRKTCLMLMRVPALDGTMAQAAMRIWGQPHDSPNFHVACGALLQMGLYPSVLMGGPNQWPAWTNASFEEAMEETRRRFRLEPGSEHEAFLESLLKSRLTIEDGRCTWPVEVRSALISWDGQAA